MVHAVNAVFVYMQDQQGQRISCFSNSTLWLYIPEQPRTQEQYALSHGKEYYKKWQVSTYALHHSFLAPVATYVYPYYITLATKLYIPSWYVRFHEILVFSLKSQVINIIAIFVLLQSVVRLLQMSHDNFSVNIVVRTPSIC